MTESARPIVEVPITGLATGSPVHFTFERDGKTTGGFLVLHEGQVHAYVNLCPHIAISLDFGDGIVMGASKKFIECQVHGAQFLPESGECFWGPPVGQRLEKLPVSATETHASVTILPTPPE